MTLRDLYDLFRRYVPIASRHPSSWPSDGALWWPAHEIGHLLTVSPAGIGLPMFGMDGNDPDLSADDRHELRCRELAAMHVSRRLLTACGRADVAEAESKDTDYDTMNYWEEPLARARVREILREHGCLRLPRTRDRLAARLVRALDLATKQGAIE
jgi:hypothetical protein